jgi:hypothetical protein
MSFENLDWHYECILE